MVKDLPLGRPKCHAVGPGAGPWATPRALSSVGSLGEEIPQDSPHDRSGEMPVCPRPCPQPAPLSGLPRLQLPQFVKANPVDFGSLLWLISVISEILRLRLLVSVCCCPCSHRSRSCKPFLVWALIYNHGCVHRALHVGEGMAPWAGGITESPWPHPKGFCIPRDSAWSHRVQELLCSGWDGASCRGGQGVI